MLFPFKRLPCPASSPMVRTRELSLASILGREGGAVKERRRAGKDHYMRWKGPMEETVHQRL